MTKTQTNTDKQACKNRIASHYKGRRKDFAVLFALMNGQTTKPNIKHFASDFGIELDNGATNDQYSEAANEAFCNYGLSIDYVAPGTFDRQKEGYLRYQLSWGGPSDEIRFFYTPGANEPYKIQYVLLDWFDGAKKNVTNDNVMLEIWYWLNDIGTPHFEYEKAMEDI